MQICPWQRQRDSLSLRPEQEQAYQARDEKGHVTKSCDQESASKRDRAERKKGKRQALLP